MATIKKTPLDRELTRRQFMKLTGKGLAGVAISGSLLDLMGCTLAQAEAGLVDAIATPDFLLVANRAKCTGCQRCEANCTLANDGDVHPYMARIRVRQNMYFGADGPQDDHPLQGRHLWQLVLCARHLQAVRRRPLHEHLSRKSHRPRPRNRRPCY
jgi:ferredoxin